MEQYRIFTSAIILALMSNTIAKAIYFWSLSPMTRKETAVKYSIYALLHIPFILWRRRESEKEERDTCIEPEGLP